MKAEDQAPYDLPPVLTVDETADFLRLNRKTVYAAITAGDLPGHKVGRRLVILRDALLSSIQAGCACCHQPKGDD